MGDNLKNRPAPSPGIKKLYYVGWSALLVVIAILIITFFVNHPDCSPTGKAVCQSHNLSFIDMTLNSGVNCVNDYGEIFSYQVMCE